MLTDYHLHLRPDDDDTPPERYFTEANVDRYLEAAEAAGIGEIGCSEHIHRFTDALTLWGDHPWWQHWATDDLGAYCEFVAASSLRLGIECDFVPGAEDRTASLLESHPFDYVVGSVHFIGDHALDTEVYGVWNAKGDPDEVWRLYFEAIAESARSGLFDILAHPDLVKYWGDARPQPAARPALLLRARGRGDRRERDRGRGLDRRAAQAGLRDLPGARLRRDVRRGRRRLRPLLRRPHPGGGRLRLRAGRSPSSRGSG